LLTVSLIPVRSTNLRDALRYELRKRL
jgi:hypothetical protein